ncbi:hypothetical protein AWM70_13195 [Paenibacillus yonginensis]|uniref:HTH-like domain-containing protein n=1 Tax=Paenibacillus yonginensis TaxID=1462996 RepID=A0A1B1N205_9BACL|nr:IS3 family transposase [Paenibacillus yonginensis]ANS75445.1 hypothetical protein AWM70_13195 [Paenibacillus yonginensis]
MFENLDAGGATQKYSAIRILAVEFEVKMLCRLFSVSRSGYYAYLKRVDYDRDKQAKELIRGVYDRYEGKCGYRQIQLLLFQDHNVWWNHKKVLRIMQALGLQAKIRRKHHCNYASSTRDRVAENVRENERRDWFDRS